MPSPCRSVEGRCCLRSWHLRRPRSITLNWGNSVAQHTTSRSEIATVPGLFPVHLAIAHRQLPTIWRGDVFSLPNRSHEIMKGNGIQVCPPSVVLSKRAEFLPCPSIAQPSMLEKKSSEVTCLKLAPGESFVHCCPPSLVL